MVVQFWLLTSKRVRRGFIWKRVLRCKSWHCLPATFRPPPTTTHATPSFSLKVKSPLRFGHRLMTSRPPYGIVLRIESTVI